MKQISEFWLKNAILYTQNESRQVRKGCLRIVEGKIDSISNQIPSQLKSTARIMDCAGLTLLPGFIQAHVHLCQSLFKNLADELELLDWLSKKIWVMEAAHTEDTLYTSALMGIHELLSSGTTCVLDMGTVRHTHSILEAVQDSGIRASVGKCLMDHPDYTPKDLREPTQEAIREAVKLYSDWNGKEKDRIRVSYAPRFAISCTKKLLEEIGQIARSQNAIIHTHASENQKEIELVRKIAGCENIEYFESLGITSENLVIAHGIWLSEKEKQILKKSGTHITHCPSSNLKLASGIAPIPDLLSRGINVALGADGSPCNNNLNMLQEMRLAALIHKPNNGPKTLRAMEALDMGTRNGAKALNWMDQIGSIEVGKQADLVAMDLNTPSNFLDPSRSLNPEAIASSIVYGSDLKHIRWTMVRGNVLFRDGTVKTIPTESLMKQVVKARKKFCH